MAMLSDKSRLWVGWDYSTDDWTLRLGLTDPYGNKYVIPMIINYNKATAWWLAPTAEDRAMKRHVLQNISNWAITELVKMELEQ